MNLRFVLALGALLSCLPLSAQIVFPQKYNGVDLSAGAGKNVANVSLVGYRCWSLGARPLFFAGGGFRVNGARFASASFAYLEPDGNNVNRLESSGFIASGNLLLLVHCHLGRQIMVGANIDLLGVAAGTASAGAGTPAASPKIGSFNLMLGPHKDIGTLNSEFYVGYAWSPKLGFRAGWSHYFIQLKNGQAAYNAYLNLAFVAAEWRW